MDTRTREKFLDHITKPSLSQEHAHLSVGNPRGELEEERQRLEASAYRLRRLIRLSDNDDFKAWLEAREHSDTAIIRDIVQGRVDPYKDPFQAGKRYGRMEVVLELRTQKDDLEKKLADVNQQLTKLKERLA